MVEWSLWICFHAPCTIISGLSLQTEKHLPMPSVMLPVLAPSVLLPFCVPERDLRCQFLIRIQFRLWAATKICGPAVTPLAYSVFLIWQKTSCPEYLKWIL